MARGLFCGNSLTVLRREVIPYAILSTQDVDDTDVAILSNVPGDYIKWIPDPTKGIASAYDFMEQVLILEGRLMLVPNTQMFKLTRVTVKKEVPADALAETILKKAKELEEVLSNSTLLTVKNTTEIDDFKVEVVLYTPAKDMDDVLDALRVLYHKVTASRKRTFFAGPSLIHVVDPIDKWIVMTIPKGFAMIKDKPDKLVATSIFDPEGFKAPVLVIDNVSLSDLPSIEDVYNSVSKLEKVFGRFTSIAEATAGAEVGEELGL